MEQVKDFLMKAWDFLNEPLPIIGLSTLMLLVFLWKIFASSSFGKKQLKRLNEGFERTKTDLELKVKMLTDENARLKEQNENFKQEIKQLVFDLITVIPNKKVQALKEKYYEGQETSNCESKEE